MADPVDLLPNTPVTLLGDPVDLLPGGPSGGLTPLPVGTGSQILIWQGGHASNDPTVAANWDPAVAPAMAANQTLVMNSGTMNLNGGNLAANQLNVSTPADKTATVNLSDHGTLDLNIPDTAIPNIDVNYKGGGEGTLNIFAGKDSDPNIDVHIDPTGKLDLQANMWFGKLDVTGGTTYLQGDSHLNGTSVQLNTHLEGYGSVELGSSGNHHPGRAELWSPVPQGVTISALEHDPQGGANGLIFDAPSASTTPGGEISLQDAFVKIRGIPITSYTQTGNEYDFYNNGTKVDALDIIPAPGAGPLQVASNANGVYVYNADPSKMPLGAGNGLGDGPKGTGPGSMTFAPESLVASNPLTPLPFGV